MISGSPLDVHCSVLIRTFTQEMVKIPLRSTIAGSAAIALRRCGP
jgi:hypothetical protein